MRKRIVTKLQLHRETLRNLLGEELKSAQGGTESASQCCGDSHNPGSCIQYCVYDPL